MRLEEKREGGRKEGEWGKCVGNSTGGWDAGGGTPGVGTHGVVHKGWYTWSGTQGVVQIGWYTRGGTL